MKTIPQLAEEWLAYDFNWRVKFSRDKQIVRDFAAFLDGLAMVPERYASSPIPDDAQLEVSSSPSTVEMTEESMTASPVPVADNGGDVSFPDNLLIGYCPSFYDESIRQIWNFWNTNATLDDMSEFCKLLQKLRLIKR